MLALIHIKICSACRLGLVKLYDNLHELPKAINTLTVASLATSEKVKLQGFMFHFSPKLQVLHSLPESILHPYLLDCMKLDRYMQTHLLGKQYDVEECL
ncbi:hypothetical protein Tco_0618826 [Tanacetum coccineum]